MPSWKAWASSLWQRLRKAKPKKRSEETVSRDTLDRLFVLPSERVHETGPFGCIRLGRFHERAPYQFVICSFLFCNAKWPDSSYSCECSHDIEEEVEMNKKWMKPVTFLLLAGVIGGSGLAASHTKIAHAEAKIGEPFAAAAELQLGKNVYVLDQQTADVTGDQAADTVFLVGTKENRTISTLPR